MEHSNISNVIQGRIVSHLQLDSFDEYCVSMLYYCIHDAVESVWATLCCDLSIFCPEAE